MMVVLIQGEAGLWNTAQNISSRSLYSFPERTGPITRGKQAKNPPLSSMQIPTYKILKKCYNVVTSFLDIVSHGQC